MHLLWISDSPDTPSGFGNVTRFVCEGLARRGHKVSILGWQTRQAFDWNGCRVHPIGRDPMGGDALYGFLLRHRPDAVIALADVWWLPYFTAPHVRRQMELLGTPWLLYFPIDGNTAEGGLPASWVDMLRAVDVPIAMSRYGQEIAAHCGIQSEYIPHGVDLATFAPPADRESAKAKVDAAGRFLVLSDSRNQPRKMLPRLLDAFSRFAAGRPDALLHLHTDPDDEFARSEYYCYDLRADICHLGLERQVRFTPGFHMKGGAGLPLASLAAYYQAADVHVLSSGGEGFGLPTLQACAAGAVPMASAYSASRELVEGHGAALAVAEWAETEFGIRRALIDVDRTAAELGRYYDDRALLREHSHGAREFALAYGWDAVIDQWDRLLRKVLARRRNAGLGAGWGARMSESRIVDSPGTSITVKMAERSVGRMEAAILADARPQTNDTRIPVLPPDCQIGGLRVPRRLGYVGMTPADVAVFLALRRVFPVLNGWAARAAEAPWMDVPIKPVPAAKPEDVRYELAQSTLLLNVAGELSESMLADAALFGVPCVGGARSAAQLALWPELVAESAADAVKLARWIFTNPAAMQRICAEGKRRCAARYAPDEAAAVRSLRHLHAAQWNASGHASQARAVA
jgi:glycosyltransferase involved in cell wall biosynthesis